MESAGAGTTGRSFGSAKSCQAKALSRFTLDARYTTQLAGTHVLMSHASPGTARTRHQQIFELRPSGWSAFGGIALPIELSGNDKLRPLGQLL